MDNLNTTQITLGNMTSVDVSQEEPQESKDTQTTNPAQDEPPSSKEDAVLLLSNSYTDRIYYLLQRIKDEENHILYLKALIPELMFEQRKIENRKKYV
jgi:hypothetical protein